MDAYRAGFRVQRLRSVPAGLSGRLHRAAAESRAKASGPDPGRAVPGPLPRPRRTPAAGSAAATAAARPRRSRAAHRTTTGRRARTDRAQVLKPVQRYELLRRLGQTYPYARSELRFRDPFELLVAVVLSAQATDVSVNKATARLFPVANTPGALLQLGEEGLKPYIGTIGLYNSKARNLIALCRKLIDEHGGRVPSDREVLRKLPGVGWKTASVVANVAFGAPTIAVDTHIFRIASRTGLAPGKTPDAVSRLLERITPPEFARDAHHWLILHGRYVCKARKPECWRCVIAGLCRFQPQTPAPTDGDRRPAARISRRSAARKRPSPARNKSAPVPR
ncbi:MAG: endonuclease III [Gammaproteobacteria bacterium]|nr:endonuclease III [Gammaproteobacteria bacterium]